MTTPIDPEIDWSLCTWKGSRRKQHQQFQAIPFSRKLEIIEEMNNSVRQLRAENPGPSRPETDAGLSS